MKLKTIIEYHTVWGEELVLCIGKRRIPLSYKENGVWEGEVAGLSSGKICEYSYELMRDGELARTEWKGHRLHLPQGAAPVRVVVRDSWNDRPEDAPFYSTAFTKAIFGRGSAGGDDRRDTSAAGAFNVLLQVNAANVRPDEVIALAASSQELGAWGRIMPFDDKDFPMWTLPLNVTEPFAYKIIIADRSTLKPVVWEEGENRWFGNIPARGEVSVEASIRTDFGERKWRGAGTAIPVFSLRSDDDLGVGEFYDLKKMVDWAAATGQVIVQLLPINDTTMYGTWEDSYPYNPNSTFALHPQYLHLPAAGVKVDEEYRALQAELNALEQFDYEGVNAVKMTLLRKAYAETFESLSQTADYREFMDKNVSWLIPYAAFCVLRDLNGTPDFNLWKGYARYSRRTVEAFCDANRTAVDFWCFVQYHLDRQLSQVCRYAHSKGVVFKGDLPIGISRTSVDAWMHPELFHMDSQAGAPPDAFSSDGQNWGFPTYNWERMAQDGFAWWKSRLAKMSEYFDAYRIDHILGFFRIWEIPISSRSGLDGYFNPALPYAEQEIEAMGFDPAEQGLFIEDPRRKGYHHPRIGARDSYAYASLCESDQRKFDGLYEDFFYHRNNGFWMEKAMQKLPALIDSTGMLACGEDLGMIPATVPYVMSALRILSLEIQRMPKGPWQEFADPSRYPYLSVCTTSTHDMNPVRAWWEEDRDVTESFYRNVLRAEGEAPSDCEPWICRKIVASHLDSPAIFTILPLSDLLSIDGVLRRDDPAAERINIPANPRHYWRYRMHLTLERLIGAEDFNSDLKDLIRSSSRSR